MKLEEYYLHLEGTPLPTMAQREQFAAHVLTAHSWYKHLDLFHGATVIVFLDPRAGGGFDEERPRVHHTWRTRAEYLQRFGHLAYMWRDEADPDVPFSTDYEANPFFFEKMPGVMQATDPRDTPVLQLPAQIQRDCAFRMYPFACDRKALYRYFEQPLLAIAKGESDHPCKELLLDFLHTQQEAKQLRRVIDSASPSLREEYRTFQFHEGELPDTVSSAMRSLLLQEREKERVLAESRSRLFDHERAKVLIAIDRLCEYLGAIDLVERTAQPTN